MARDEGDGERMSLVESAERLGARRECNKRSLGVVALGVDDEELDAFCPAVYAARRAR